jgi:hypothetical protein
MVATPELLEFDDARLTHDLVGVHRMLAFDIAGTTQKSTYSP